MRVLPAVLVATSLLLARPAAAQSPTATLAPGASVTYDFRSSVFAELVARATLTLTAGGTDLVVRVQLLPASTFVTRLSLVASPPTAIRSASVVGYRAIDVGFPPPGFDLTFAFAGDPGLGGAAGAVATVTATLVQPATGGLALGAARADVYGFRGSTVPNDAVVGTVASVVPEPGALALTATGASLLALAGMAVRRGR